MEGIGRVSQGILGNGDVPFLKLGGKVYVSVVGMGARDTGRVLPDSLRKDLDKLRAVFPCGSILNVNNADPEILGKVNKFNVSSI